MAAPIPFQAPEVSWIVVSHCGRDKSRVSASRCVTVRRMAVYIFIYQSINDICHDTRDRTHRAECLESNTQ